MTVATQGLRDSSSDRRKIFCFVHTMAGRYQKLLNKVAIRTVSSSHQEYHRPTCPSFCTRGAEPTTERPTDNESVLNLARHLQLTQTPRPFFGQRETC